MNDHAHTLEPQGASAVLEELVDAFPNDRISVGELVDQLEGRAHGVLLLILALPMCIPNVPGISTIFGFLMLAPALQLALGQRRLWVPQRARGWTFPRDGLHRALSAAIPTLKRLEYLIRPRLGFLTRWPVTTYVGLQTLMMAIILILPVWGANWPPGITVALTALALLQRDGILMLLTVPAAAGSAAALYFGAKLGFEVLERLGAWVGVV
ncbi:MAG TPA: exopolysaccharide biosynthesis protein [Caulobacterales bacterium]|nr:exopolysaccharide biosynthesis protein [Caulobacterales bacterium]